MKALSAILLTLLMSMGAWAEDIINFSCELNYKTVCLGTEQEAVKRKCKTNYVENNQTRPLAVSVSLTEYILNINNKETLAFEMTVGANNFIPEKVGNLITHTYSDIEFSGLRDAVVIGNITSTLDILTKKFYATQEWFERGRGYSTKDTFDCEIVSILKDGYNIKVD